MNDFDVIKPPPVELTIEAKYMLGQIYICSCT